MDLIRTHETSTVHRKGCYRAKGKAVPWTYGNGIPDEVSLSAQTMYSPWLHLCKTCLPGLCYCQKCQAKKSAALAHQRMAASIFDEPVPLPLGDNDPDLLRIRGSKTAYGPECISNDNSWQPDEFVAPVGFGIVKSSIDELIKKSHDCFPPSCQV